MKTFTVFVKKEFLHIFRDRRTMLILLVMPVVMIVLFGFAINTDVKDSRVVLLDHSQDELTGRIKEHLLASPYFTLAAEADEVSAVHRLFRENKADIAVVFGAHFTEELTRTGTAAVQVLTDGTEPNQASIRSSYVEAVLASCLPDLLSPGTAPAAYRIEPVVRMLYNPQSRSEFNFVPGVIGLILLLIGAMMTSIAIVKEKETGTLEVLLVSPLSPFVIVVAKLVPYFVLSCTNLMTILLLSTRLLHIPIAGSLAGLVGVTVLYILVALLLGLFISTCAESQLAAMLLSLLLIVPTVYLSGLAFPIGSMPVALQRASLVFPARWYVEAARKLMIQGVEMRYVAGECAILAGMAFALLCVSWKLFKTRL